MSQGLYTSAPTDFDPTLPLAVPPSGSDILTHRYIAELISDNPVAAWTDALNSATPLVTATGGSAPALASVSGEQFVRTDGAGSGLLYTLASGEALRTAIMVCRIGAASGVVFSGGGISVARDATHNAAQLTVTGATSSVLTADNSFPLNTWVVISVSRPSSATTTLTINGVVTPALAGAPTGLMTRFTIGKDGSTSWAVDVAEILLGSVAMTAPQIAAVETAMHAAHPRLLG